MRGSILVVEDNTTTAKTLRVFLESEGYRVSWAASGHDALLNFADPETNLVLLDIMLPDLDGISVCRAIRARSPVPIIMLTAKTTEDEIVAGLEAGADDYVCKPFGSRELLARVRRRLDASSPADVRNDTLSIGDIIVDLKDRLVTCRGSVVRLTRSEFEILALLIGNQGRVFTRNQIIEQALGHDFDGFDRTVDTHIWSLRKKLGEPRGAPRYLHSELGVGYRLRDKHEE